MFSKDMRVSIIIPKGSLQAGDCGTVRQSIGPIASVQWDRGIRTNVNFDNVKVLSEKNVESTK